MIAVREGFLEIATLLAEGTNRDLQDEVTRVHFFWGWRSTHNKLTFKKKEKKKKRKKFDFEI